MAITTEMQRIDMVAILKSATKGFLGNPKKTDAHDWLTETGMPHIPFVLDFGIATLSIPLVATIAKD